MREQQLSGAKPEKSSEIEKNLHANRTVNTVFMGCAMGTHFATAGGALSA
jgi:hypothetical protein